MEARNSDRFPGDPLQRYSIFCRNLLRGIYWCLWKKDPRLAEGVNMALEGVGLAFYYVYKSPWWNPSDEMLERSMRFITEGIIPKRRRGRARDTTDPLAIWKICAELSYILGDLPGKSRNPNHRHLLVKERLSDYLRDYVQLDPDCRAVSEKELRSICDYPKRRLVVELVAKLYGQSASSIDKKLDQFHKTDEHKIFPRFWKIDPNSMADLDSDPEDDELDREL